MSSGVTTITGAKPFTFGGGWRGLFLTFAKCLHFQCSQVEKRPRQPAVLDEAASLCNFFWRLPICVALCEVEERKRRKMQVQALAASIPHSFVAALMCRARTLGCHMQNVRKASWIFKRRGLKLVDTVTNIRCAQHLRAGFGELSLCLKIEVDVV